MVINKTCRTCEFNFGDVCAGEENCILEKCCKNWRKMKQKGANL